jgi:hypothetical protein
MVDDPGGDPAYIKIGIRDVWLEQRAQGERITKIDQTLDVLAHSITALTATAASIESVRHDVDTMKALGAGADHEKRIQRLERYKAALPLSVAMGLAAIGAVAVQALR